MTTTTTTVLLSGAGDPVGPGGLRLRVPAARTGGELTVHEGHLEAGQTVPTHVHETTDQLLYVVTGSVRVTVGDETVTAGAGDFVLKPRGVPHGFTALEASTALELSLDGAFESFLEAMDAARGPDDVAAAQAAHGMSFLPLPGSA